jgi:hypothetical protein
MTHRLISSFAIAAVCTTLGVAAGAAGIQEGQPKQGTKETAPKTQDLTVTGCVVQGTDSGIYVLSNVVATPDVRDVPRTFRLVSAGEELDFTLHSNHQVQVAGLAEFKVPPDAPPGGRIDARDLPAFSVKTIRSVSDRCLAQ